MIIRHVYPKLDMWYFRRGIHDCDRQLLITSEYDDGKCWFGVKEGIKNYLEEYGMDISKVTWYIQVRPNGECVKITAKTVNEWVKKFNELKPVFEKVEDEW